MAPDALAATPTVDQRHEAAWLVGELALQIAGDIAGDQRRADASGAEARVLHVDGPDLGPLGVVEHRQADRAGHMVLGELGGAAHVDDRVEGAKRLRGRRW